MGEVSKITYLLRKYSDKILEFVPGKNIFHTHAKFQVCCFVTRYTRCSLPIQTLIADIHRIYAVTLKHFHSVILHYSVQNQRASSRWSHVSGIISINILNQRNLATDKQSKQTNSCNLVTHERASRVVIHSLFVLGPTALDMRESYLWQLKFKKRGFNSFTRVIGCNWNKFRLN